MQETHTSAPSVASQKGVNPDPFLRPEQAAEYLGVSVTFVRREAAAGDLPSVRFGRLLRFRRSDLEAYVRANTSGCDVR